MSYAEAVIGSSVESLAASWIGPLFDSSKVFSLVFREVSALSLDSTSLVGELRWKAFESFKPWSTTTSLAALFFYSKFNYHMWDNFLCFRRHINIHLFWMRMYKKLNWHEWCWDDDKNNYFIKKEASLSYAEAVIGSSVESFAVWLIRIFFAVSWVLPEVAALNLNTTSLVSELWWQTFASQAWVDNSCCLHPGH